MTTLRKQAMINQSDNNENNDKTTTDNQLVHDTYHEGDLNLSADYFCYQYELDTRRS